MACVFVTRRIFDEAIALLDEAGLDVLHNVDDVPLTAGQIRLQARDAEALISLLTDKIDASLMDVLPNLKVIANVAVGYDNIDVQAATARGIVVTNTPDVLTECTADLTFALLLAIARRVVEADTFTRAGLFQGWQLFQPHLGTDVFGKTLGILGMGRIGAAVARRGALGFGMKVIYTSPTPRTDVEKDLGAGRVDLSTLLGESDFLSIHVPLTPETHHLFTLKEFAQMKPSSFLINTARGPIIKEGDLVLALRQSLLAGAALDVFEKEPEVHPDLIQMRDKAILVPHIGSASVETRRRMSVTAATNVVAALQGQMPPNTLNTNAWRVT